jgi:hypothetical protein
LSARPVGAGDETQLGSGLAHRKFRQSTEAVRPAQTIEIAGGAERRGRDPTSGIEVLMRVRTRDF